MTNEEYQALRTMAEGWRRLAKIKILASRQVFHSGMEQKSLNMVGMEIANCFFALNRFLDSVVPTPEAPPSRWRKILQWLDRRPMLGFSARVRRPWSRK